MMIKTDDMYPNEDEQMKKARKIKEWIRVVIYLAGLSLLLASYLLS